MYFYNMANFFCYFILDLNQCHDVIYYIYKGQSTDKKEGWEEVCEYNMWGRCTM